MSLFSILRLFCTVMTNYLYGLLIIGNSTIHIQTQLFTSTMQSSNCFENKIDILVGLESLDQYLHAEQVGLHSLTSPLGTAK